MPTSVHIPKPLLAKVDRKARMLKISRNRLIVQALERELEEPGWPPGFFDQLRAIEPKTADLMHDVLAAIVANRRSKPPLKL